jgi:7-keto-8-aminopelargonate synthetase-like enzyme
MSLSVTRETRTADEETGTTKADSDDDFAVIPARAACASRAPDEGFLVVVIRPPTVPKGAARLRLSFTALHPDDEIERLAEIVRARILPC